MRPYSLVAAVFVLSIRTFSTGSAAFVLWILMLSQSAQGAEGTIFTPGQMVVNYGNTAIVKVSNHTPFPLGNVVVLAVGGKDVIEFQQSLRAIRPGQTVDVLFQPPRDPLNWQPMVFVPASGGQDGVYFDLFIQQGEFSQATFSDPPMSQYPNKLWHAIADSVFTAPDILRYGDMPEVSSRTLGPIYGGRPQPGDAVFIKNLGATPINAFLYCVDGNGQEVPRCGGPNVVQPHDYSTVYAVQLSKPVFLVLCAEGEASRLWANLLIGSINYPNELWDVHRGPDSFCAGKARPLARGNVPATAAQSGPQVK
jgi:hypothetical protein